MEEVDDGRDMEEWDSEAGIVSKGGGENVSCIGSLLTRLKAEEDGAAKACLEDNEEGE